MTALRRVCVAGLLGMWWVAGAAQEPAEETAAGEQEQQAVAPESGSTAAGAISQADSSEQLETTADTDADADVTDAGEADPGAADTGEADTGEAFPEIAPLDELFVPSQNIRADEPVTFPVDF